MARHQSLRAGARFRYRPQLEILEDRITPDAGLAGFDALATVATSYDTAHVLVQFEAGFDPHDLLPGGAALGEALPLVSNLYVVNLPTGWTVPQMLDAIGSNPHVILAQPDYQVQLQLSPDDTSFSSQWGLDNTGQSGGTVGADIDAVSAWDVTTGTGGVIVAIIDTGIAYDHSDLAANIWTNSGEIAGNGVDDDGNGFIDDLHGWDFYNDDSDPMDDNSHGTHVAGIIGAVGNNATGVAGVTWDVQLMAVKFLGATGSGSTSDAIKALDYAVQMGATISNNSWGGGGFNQALSDAIDNAGAAGHIFVAAAGNNSSDNDVTAFYPATYDLANVVSVASTDRYDNLSSFSNYGLTTVDLAAPGTSIYSTVLNDAYGTKSGTSMATPFVTGALALVWDLNPDWTYDQVISQVLSTVDPLASLDGKVATGGRLNLASALSTETTTPLPTVSIDSVSVTEGDSGTTNLVFTVTLSASSTDTVTVNYATAGGTATSDTDFVSQSGTVTFDPGETSKTVTIVVNGDTDVESDETFTVDLSDPSNATLGTSQGVGTIENDDTSVTISIGNASVTEGNKGTKFMTFTVTLSEASGVPVTVNYATANDTASAGTDYFSTSGSLTFAAGETTKTIKIKIKGDKTVEPDETFFVKLSSPTNATLATSQGTGTIINDD